MSEATFRSSAGERAATPLRPSTPHNVSRSSPPNQEYCGQSEDRILHHTAQCDTVCFERVRSQLPAGALQLDQTKTMRARMMRGVITGPARWRGANASCGTPNLYCAVYKYSFTQCVVHSSASSAQSSSRSPESGYLPLPPPKLVSSTWGQGPLVIDGVPVLERHANTLGEYAEKGSPCGDELQSIFVLTVGVFRSRITSISSTPLISEGGNHRKNGSIPLPRPEDLLGVLHIPLHCVNIAEKQQEIKLRLPVTHLSPKPRNHAGPAIQIEAEGEQGLAALLSPVTSLEKLEKLFLDSLSASATGANRCNVMLFRLSGNSGPFLWTSDAMLQAALTAPSQPSVASTTLQRSVSPCELHDDETSRLTYQGHNGLQIQHDVGTAEVTQAARASSSTSRLQAGAYAEGIRCRGASAGHESATAPAHWSQREDTEQLLSPRSRQPSTAGPSGSVASNNVATDQQRQRHQRRQQELSVAAVLAASAIAAAARGERDRSSRSSTSKKAQQSQRLVSGLGLRSSQRPSSVCGVVASSRTLMEKGSNDSLIVHPHSLGHERTRILHERRTPATCKTKAGRATELGGEPELSPDDSVSVRGDETHRLAATLANRSAQSAHSVASCMPVEGLVPSECSVRLTSQSDDRKSTLTTSIRRLDCLMTRAQLLLSQRRHRQLQQGEHKQTSTQESVHDGLAGPQALTSTLQATPTNSLKIQNSVSEGADALGTGRRGSTQEVLTQDRGELKLKSPGNRSSESTRLKGFSPDGATQQGPPPCFMRDLSSTAKVVKWLNAQNVRQKGILTKKAHAGERQCRSGHNRKRESTHMEDVSQQGGGNRGRESEQQVQELIQLVEGLQKQVQARDDWCKHLEKRSSEEQQKHTQEMSALRRQIIALQEELKQKGPKDADPPASKGGDKDRQRVQQELDVISQERRQLQLLAAEHAKATACAEEEKMRLQNELAANQERTRDLEHQLLLVDQQLVGILNQATAHGETSAGLTHSEPSPPLGTWALKKLQGMRETLRGIDGKEPLGRTAQARRQPPSEAATFAPLQKLSQDSPRHAENVRGQVPSLTEQQQCLQVLRQQRPSTPQYHHPIHTSHEAQMSPPMSQLPEPDVQKNQPPQQQRGPWSNERREPSPTGYQCMGQQSVEQTHADVQPEVSNRGNLTTTAEVQHQHLHMRQGAQVLPRNQQLTEHLNRQRNQRQHLLQQRAHPLQQTLYNQMSPHLQASFSSNFRDPQVAVQNYAVCSFPLHLRQGTNAGPATDHHIRGVSPQCNGRVTPSRANARCLGLNVA
ncbi:hypothetical protein, conserved [Eimeria maxima]|uniref:Uncharacterized protein n=1 Tax=Eimeria maxima TaxID=5804 RepID=U6MDT8_EIMMA|nr:hypothetical protein, conserved [Eimeria maxima]CDJ60599.1 hypothetical protein, conserved [Eimeria maxima]